MFDQNNGANLDGLSNAALAGLMVSNLRGGGTTQVVTTRVIEAANRRWDDALNYFKNTATDESRIIDIRANAQLGEAYYLGWRALDDRGLREKAGEILGHVSTAFDTNAALYATDDEPIYQPHEIWELGTVAAAIQFFLTASETTGRRTYMPRALIVAECAAERVRLEDAPFEDRIEFVLALLRLEQFTDAPKYGRQAREILHDALQGTPPGYERTALAIEAAEHFPLHIVIVGDVENDANANAMWFEAMKVDAPLRAIEVLHPLQHATRIEQLGYEVTDASARAYICTGAACLPAVKSPEAFREAMRRLRGNSD